MKIPVIISFMCSDEILANSFGDSVHREKPIPPPKPVAKTNSYETLKEFLEKEGKSLLCSNLDPGCLITLISVVSFRDPQFLC